MRERKVYCRGCAHLFYFGASSPLCLANASFVNGPLRPHVDVVGGVPAERYNLFNDCPSKRVISFRSMALKRWMIWRINYGTEGKKIRESSIRAYSVVTENEKSRIRRGKTEKGFDRGVEEIEGAGLGETIQEYTEDVLGDGGADGGDFGGSDDPVV